MTKSIDPQSTHAMRHCRILGSNVTYWDYHNDQSTVIVAIHGFRGTHHGLEFIIDKLPNYRVIAPDLPGFGDSSPMHGRVHNAENYSEFVKHFITFLDLPKPPILLGHSFGSTIVARVAAEAGSAISQLVLINPISAHGSTVANRAGMQATQAFYLLGQILPARAGHALLKNQLATRVMSRLLLQTREEALKRRVHQQHGTHFSRFHNREVLRQAFVSSSTNTVAEHAPRIPTKTLLVVGAKDAIVPLPSQRALQQLFPQATLKVIDYTGHLIHYETPSEAAQHISDFVG